MREYNSEEKKIYWLIVLFSHCNAQWNDFLLNRDISRQIKFSYFAWHCSGKWNSESSKVFACICIYGKKKKKQSKKKKDVGLQMGEDLCLYKKALVNFFLILPLDKFRVLWLSRVTFANGRLFTLLWSNHWEYR